MDCCVLFGNLPAPLLIPATDAQRQLHMLHQDRARKLEELWGTSFPHNTARSIRRRLSGRRLAEGNKLRKEMYLFNVLSIERGSLQDQKWVSLPSTPSAKEAKAQLKAIYAFKRLLHAFLQHEPSGIVNARDKELTEATAACEAAYQEYWNGLKASYQ